MLCVVVFTKAKAIYDVEAMIASWYGDSIVFLFLFLFFFNIFGLY